jgi:hypothetical protein
MKIEGLLDRVRLWSVFCWERQAGREVLVELVLFAEGARRRA